MIPKIRQFRKWTLPTRWGVLASLATVVSTALAAMTFWLAIAVPTHERTLAKTEERQLLVLQAAQELRNNSDILTQIRSLEGNDSIALGETPYSVESLKILANDYSYDLNSHGLGEEKHIYQEVLRLERWLSAIRAVNTAGMVLDWNSGSDFTIDDALFLNDFLWWYIQPAIEDDLTDTQKRTLGWEPYPRSTFRLHANQSHMKQLVLGDEPLSDFRDYLDLLD